MAKLKRKSNDSEILADLGIAVSFYSRLKGLLGTKTLEQGKGLLFPDCNSIHTFFMNYSIDCIFLDADMKVVSLCPQVNPGKMLWPQSRASIVVEMAAGQLQKFDLKIGEELYVGD